MEKKLIFWVENPVITPQNGVEVVKRPDENFYRVYATDEVALNLFERYKESIKSTTPHLSNLKNFPSKTQVGKRFSEEAK